METRSKKASKLAISTAKTKIPSLPCEIISNIIRYLSPDDDKHTLAQCMRVSPTFNAIAAPRLYRCIDVSFSSDVLAGYNATPSQSRQTFTKAELIHLTRVLQLPLHDWDDCPCDPLLNGDIEWRVTTLRILTAKGFSHSCVCFEGAISPRKLVFRDPNPFHGMHTPRSATRLLERLVLVMDKTRHISNHTILKPPDVETSRPIKLVCVILTPDSESPISSYRENFWASFLRGVVCHAGNTGVRDDITIVNIQALRYRRNNELRAADGSDAAKWEARLSRAQHHWLSMTRRQAHVFGHKGAQTMEKIKFRLVNMETYLTDYDWEDEFSPKDVQGWLDEMARKKEQKRKEEQDEDNGGGKEGRRRKKSEAENGSKEV